jgi:Fe-S cluster assembly ATP-binding protein
MQFWEGHVHAVVGPNGAGKSTLASAVMGLAGYQKYQGDILFQGQSVKGWSIDERARQGITMAWQEPARYEGLSVHKFITAGTGNGNGEMDPGRMLEIVGLDPDKYLNRAVDRTLSGGERKRIELASILAMKPSLVLMDEPDSGIDVEALNRIFDSLDYLKKLGATVLLITHSMEVLRHAEHAFLMCCGRMQSKGMVDQVQKVFFNRCIPCDHKNLPEKNGEDQ